MVKASWDNFLDRQLFIATGYCLFYIKCYFAGTQWPLIHVYPAGQSKSMAHVKLGSARFKRFDCFLIWFSATPAPTQISTGVRHPASNANMQLRKPLILPPPYDSFKS